MNINKTLPNIGYDDSAMRRSHSRNPLADIFKNTWNDKLLY